MIGHIPPGFDTLQTYEEFYLNLTKQYRDTIVGHLFGHTHHDEFKLVIIYIGLQWLWMRCSQFVSVWVSGAG